MPKRKKPKVVPPRGPATNLRPAGAHDDKKRKALERLGDKDVELDELTSLGRWAYDEDD
jgi:hypothetical protein